MSLSEISSFESDITFFAKRHDPDTRKWLFEDFDAWFRNPGDSRAYVLLGDPGVGKTVVAGVLTQRMREAGQLGAAYFCSHDDSTRNAPKCLLGTVARQLCDCNTQYKVIAGGEDGVKMLLDNDKFGVRELFTKLLHEPLGKCLPCQQRLLVIIDALDETEYESREDFLDLIMRRLPLLPEWLVFFITSRPEESVLFRLKKYNPCVKICAGNRDQKNVYQQHEQDIQTFLKKRIDFTGVPYSVGDLSKTCNGLFLYAHYIVEEVRVLEKSGKNLSQLTDLFPGKIDDFFRQNFRRVYDQVGQNIFKELFGCAIVAPSPLPVSIISYILKKENSNHDEQHVIDAVSQFVVLRTPDETLTFLHSLVPAWLTDKKKARELFIDKKMAREYLRDVFVEILSSIAHEPSSAGTSICVDLEDYVVRIAVRFFCQFGGKDSLKRIFSCLTSYHFVKRRLLCGKIEIYHLLEDLKIAADCLGVDEKQKQDILEEISVVLQSNVLVFYECPHLLHSCLRRASNVLQETFLIPKLPVPWLEWNVFAFPDPTIANMHCFATTSNKKRVAGAQGRSLLFFDLSTAQILDRPFEIRNDIINSINQLEFSPDDKFIFFGRLDKWFSVERKCVEDFPQFSKTMGVYQWGVLTRDRQSIVVKRDLVKIPYSCKHKSCLIDLLALWAVKEIEQSRDDEASLHEELIAGGPVKCLLKYLALKTNFDLTQVTPRFYNSACIFCPRLKSLTDKGSHKELSSTAIRQNIIDIYALIFECQIWNLETGMPVLQHVFLQNVQLEPFTYICHVAYVLNKGIMEMECPGVSICNIAVLTTIRYLEGGLGLTLEFEQHVESKLAKKSDHHVEHTVKLTELLEHVLERDLVLGVKEELKRRLVLELESVLKRRNELEHECDSEPSGMTEMEHGPTSKLKLTRGFQDELGVILELRQELEFDAMRVLESKLKLEKEMGMEIEQVELQLKQELELAPEREYELEHELASIAELKRELERQRGQELEQLEVKLKRELEWTLERELDLEHKLANIGEPRRTRRWGLGIEPMDVKRRRQLELTLERKNELRDELASKAEQRRKLRLEPMDVMLRRQLELTLERKSKLRDELARIAEHRRKLTLEPMDIKLKRELEQHLVHFLENKLKQEQELYHRIQYVQYRLDETMCEMTSGPLWLEALRLEDLEDMKQAQQLDDELESTQEWMGWVQNVLMRKQKGNLMVKKYRWLMLKGLKVKLKQELEQWLEDELDNLRVHKMMLIQWKLWGRYLELGKQKWEISMMKEFHNGAFMFEAYTNIPKGFHDLVNEVNGDMCFCFSPEGKWVLEAVGFPNICNLQTRNRELSCNHGTTEHIISKVTRFSFTNDDRYFVYLSDDGSLHALSLQTGTVLTSVLGSNHIYFTKQRQCGYLFRSNTEEKAILLSNLFNPFKFIAVSPVEPSVVGKSIAVVFCSSNTVLAVSSDLKVTIWRTTEDKEGIDFISQSLFRESVSQVLHVKNCVLSPDGRLIAIHQESKLRLFSCTESKFVEFLCTVFETESDNTVVSSAFSADSALLLFCIQDFKSPPHCYVWDVKGKFVTGNVTPQAFLAVECCCVSSHKQKVILCGDYQIEIWRYNERPRLLATLDVEKIYHSLKFSRCTVSLDDRLLVCCIANTILVYGLNAADVNSSKRVLHGHLGTIEFCQFLKGNRYLISYGIDGMIFLWELSESKAVSFARVTLETVVCMAVSPDEDKVVCFTSSNRVCVIKLCNLESTSYR